LEGVVKVAGGGRRKGRRMVGQLLASEKERGRKRKTKDSLDIRRVHLHKGIVRLEHLPYVPGDLSTQTPLLVVPLKNQPLRGRLERRQKRAFMEAEEALEPAKDHLAFGERNNGLLSVDGGFRGLDVELDNVTEAGAVGLFGPVRRDAKRSRKEAERENRVG
jgi:hypothetical protein